MEPIAVRCNEPGDKRLVSLFASGFPRINTGMLPAGSICLVLWVPVCRTQTMHASRWLVTTAAYGSAWSALTALPASRPESSWPSGKTIKCHQEVSKPGFERLDRLWRTIQERKVQAQDAGRSWTDEGRDGLRSWAALLQDGAPARQRHRQVCAEGWRGGHGGLHRGGRPKTRRGGEGVGRPALPSSGPVGVHGDRAQRSARGAGQERGDQRRRGEGVAEPAMSLGQGQAAWLEPSLPTRLPLGQQKRIRASRLHTTVFAKSGCKSLVKIHLAAKSSNRGRKSILGTLPSIAAMPPWRLEARAAAYEAGEAMRSQRFGVVLGIPRRTKLRTLQQRLAVQYQESHDVCKPHHTPTIANIWRHVHGLSSVMPILLATQARGHFLPVCGKHIEEGAQSQTRKRMLPSQPRGSRLRGLAAALASTLHCLAPRTFGRCMRSSRPKTTLVGQKHSQDFLNEAASSNNSPSALTQRHPSKEFGLVHLDPGLEGPPEHRDFGGECTEGLVTAFVAASSTCIMSLLQEPWPSEASSAASCHRHRL
eukprot:s988_g14.t2